MKVASFSWDWDQPDSMAARAHSGLTQDNVVPYEGEEMRITVAVMELHALYEQGGRGWQGPKREEAVIYLTRMNLSEEDQKIVIEMLQEKGIPEPRAPDFSLDDRDSVVARVQFELMQDGRPNRKDEETITNAVMVLHDLYEYGGKQWQGHNRENASDYLSYLTKMGLSEKDQKIIIKMLREKGIPDPRQNIPPSP